MPPITRRRLLRNSALLVPTLALSPSLGASAVRDGTLVDVVAEKWAIMTRDMAEPAPAATPPATAGPGR